MTLREWRLARSGRCVKDWEPCVRFLEGSYCVIKDRLEMFLAEQARYKGRCVFSRGDPPIIVPKILIEFRPKPPEIFSDADGTIILTQMYKLVGWRTNLRFNSLGSPGPFVLAFEIVLSTYFSYADRQLELDWLGAFGGAASPPDFSRCFQWQKMPWEPPWFPPKNNQSELNLVPPISGIGASGLPHHHWKRRRIIKVNWEED